MPGGVNVSRDLLWLLTSNNNNYTFKRKGISKRFTTDPMNPKGIASQRFTAAIQKKALTVQPHASGKGVQLVYKTQSTKPVKSIVRVPLTKSSRRTLSTIRKFCNKNLYRTDLKNAALRRASALLRSQKPRPGGKRRGAKPVKKE